MLVCLLRRPRVLLAAIALPASPMLVAVEAQLPHATADSVALTPAARISAATTGASVAVLDSAAIAASGARTLSELLLARVPGLSVRHRGGTEADGFEIVSRGLSPAAGATPLLVVDGIIADAHQALVVPGTTVTLSRLDDLTPADVQRIEVLRGPAASALYGFGAAGGVIVVTTRRGSAGPLRLDVTGSVGLTEMDAPFPANFELTDGTPQQHCNPRTLPPTPAGSCTPTTIYSWNPLRDASPFRVGRAVVGGAALSGTARGVRLFGGLTAERANGVTDDDRQSRFGVRGSVERSLPGHVTVSAQGSYLQRDAATPTRGFAITNENVMFRGLMGQAYDDSLRGYLGPDPASQLTRPTQPSLARVMTALRVEWAPVGWLSVDALAGQDRSRESALRATTLMAPYTETREFAFARDGWTSGTMHVGATARYGAPADIAMATYVGYDDVRTHDETVDSSGIGDNFSSTSWTWSNRRVQEATVRQHVAWADVFDVNAGTRYSVDRGISAPFGRAASRNVDASYRLPSPRPGVELRLRAAAGIVPLVPPRTLYLTFIGAFGPTSVVELRSRQGEREGGIEAAFGSNSRLSLTWFRAQTRDAVVGAVLLPFGGAPQLADLTNSGIEAVGSARLLHGARVGWRSTVTLATLRSKVTSLSSAPVASKNGRVTAGYPLQGYWSNDYSWSDVNGDGFIAPSEVVAGSNSSYVGPSRPTLEMGLHNAVTLPRGITLAALLDYRHGQYRDNQSEAVRCGYGSQLCEGLQGLAMPLTDQARWAAVGKGLVHDISPASYLRLREVVIEWAPPASRTGEARRLAVRLVGQNLLTWTRYDGSDPEVGASSLQASVAPSELFDSPLPKRMRVEVRIGVM